MDRVEYNQNTKSLKDLIKHIDNSGSSAWIAGKKLNVIKKNRTYLIEYNTFNQYCKREFNISRDAANTYIKIFKSFSENEVKDLFLTHLKTISSIVNDPIKRRIITKTISNYSEDFNNRDVTTIASFVDNYDEYDEIFLKNKITEIFVENRIDRERKKSNHKRVLKFGKPLQSDFITEIGFEKEPINEMGVVGLFCLIFPYIKGYFEMNKEKVAFKSIKYIQSPFPDACIVCKVKDNKQTETELFIEFEFESFEYINHKHHLSSKKCDMIICWKDNAKTKLSRKNLDLVKNMPPVFELSSFLKSGNTELLY